MSPSAEGLPPEVRRYKTRHRRPDPARAALLVIDLQNYFKDVARPILDRVARLISHCRQAGVPVLYTQHGHRNPAQDRGMLAEWWGELIEYGSEAWAFIPEVRPGPGERVYEKTRYSAFHGTTLAADLARAGRTDLVLAGVLTNCCCETTAREAFVRDLRVFFLTDGTATVNEELHLASLKNLAFGFAYLAATGEVIEAFGPGSGL